MSSHAVAEVQYPWRKLRLQMMMSPSQVRAVLHLLDIYILLLLHIAINTEINFIFFCLQEGKEAKGGS
jgi:hypothetical protein